MAPTANDPGSILGSLTETHRLFTRADSKDPSRGVLDPHDINNAGFFVLFALIGVGFVLTGIWFFFWAKNGGFHFRETDWDDYKTTVLRRRGPNGTVLSGATESTDLGGGSVYKDVADYDGRTVITDSTYMTGITAGASDLGAREKRMKKKEKRDKEREQRRQERGEKSDNRRHVGDEGVEDAEAEAKAKAELRNYRHEKPARVGGLNKQSEGSEWDGSTNPADSTVSSSLLSGRETTPSSTPTKTSNSSPSKASSSTPSKDKRGIRKVYSTADRNDRNERERTRAEARRQREENRIVRRDFSFQRSVVGTESMVAESLLESNSDLGTKSYHHPMPELRQAQRQREREEREERRARRGGYRRGRGDDEDL